MCIFGIQTMNDKNLQTISIDSKFEFYSKNLKTAIYPVQMAYAYKL